MVGRAVPGLNPGQRSGERRQAFTDGAYQFANRPKTGKQSSLLSAEKSEAGG